MIKTADGVTQAAIHCNFDAFAMLGTPMKIQAKITPKQMYFCLTEQNVNSCFLRENTAQDFERNLFFIGYRLL
ncbi:hypothetical protein [Zooshikella harenae]|uniref:Uncharacterized protein n=1 Tax=Zooshikella harenae TaxID=2827238 RepID=A0ABS5ZFR1_9GAMM|nr:hypothetical protein [Zooshikella harenae]MBU2712608.1 hypothetical protein [Zooshikella harenae]